MTPSAWLACYKRLQYALAEQDHERALKSLHSSSRPRPF